MSLYYKITSESVGIGHPDKICDQIADSILDVCLHLDSNSRVACEVFASNHLIVIGGEITTKGYVDVIKNAWDILKPLGYNENDFTILSNINKQSEDISNLVNKSNDIFGAGDQGIMFGYATNETKEFMPVSIVLAHKICKNTEKLIKSKQLIGAKFDMKSQVSIEYSRDNKPTKIDSMLMSIQHDINANINNIRKIIIEKVMIPLAKEYGLNTNFNTFINASGPFVIGGPFGDTGLTGRKIIVDTYGGIAHHGGGAFSGKDYTKVDRTGAYFARYIAKNIVAANLADKCEIQLSFTIGSTKPSSIFIDTFNSNKIELEKIYQIVKKYFDFDLNDIIKKFNLKKQKYQNLSVYGHFGREDLELNWEKTDLAEKIKTSLNQKK